MNNIISSIFSHEIKNSLTSIRFGLEMFQKYDMDKNEIKESSLELIQTINHTLMILEEYLNFIKFQFSKKLKYENLELDALLEEIKKELEPFAHKKGVNIYIQKSHLNVINSHFWLKRAIYNIVFNAVKYNKKSGSVNIKIEKSVFGFYLSISDTGIGINRKKLKSIFKFFERVDENSKGFGIGLALSKSVVESIGGKISVKSNENIGSEFILYIPYRPKEITINILAKGVVASSIVLFFGISYFPIYSQNYTISNNGGYITYKLEDGSVLKFDENAKYKLSLNKNLYNTNYSIDTKLFEGAMTLNAIKAKAQIAVDKMQFQNLGTDFEIEKDDNIKVAVFEGAVQTSDTKLRQKEGLVIDKKGQKRVKLLDKVESLKVKKDILSFKDNPKAIKYQILVSKYKDFSKIERSFFTTKRIMRLRLDTDTLYYIKVFAYDENELPSLPNVVSFVNLAHYYRALDIQQQNIEEAILELQNSTSTIKNYSSLPYYQLAKLYFKIKKYNEAIKLLNKAISIDKKLYYYKLLADNYIAIKKYNKLELIVDKLLKTFPDDNKLLYYKAYVLKDKNPLYAQKILFKLLQLYPKDKKSNLLMSEVLRKLGKIELSNYYKGLAK